ncbi:radical SAM protein [Bacteroidota bacterium]
MNFKYLSFYKSSFLYIFNTLILRKEIPFMGGIAINDKCNLNCEYCSVANRNIPDLTFQEINKGLNALHQKGITNLYIEGGEPFMWEENEKNLEDVIQLAKNIGFRFITLYTNGTFPIETTADTVFVSLDGLKEVNDEIRGGYDKIISNIKKSNHKKIIINCTISSKNKNEIENFCTTLKDIKNIKGFFFYFYTPSPGKDYLTLTHEEKKAIVKQIMHLKQKGIPIFNSKAALKSVYNDNWVRPNKMSYLFAENNMYKCCRMIGNDDICKNCGYLGFTEIKHISRLNPSAVFTAFNYL